MNSIVGITSNKTLKVRGQIREEDVIVLIDSGASHNFVSHDLVRKLGLQVEKGKKFGVMVDNEFTVRGEGICQRVQL